MLICKGDMSLYYFQDQIDVKSMGTCPVGCFHIYQNILHIIYLRLILVSEKPILTSDTGLLNSGYKSVIIFRTQQMKSVHLYTFCIHVSL
jgi:hypothetical protein